MTLNYYHIGQMIKSTRQRKHLSQAELAEMAEASVPYISQIETGRKQISLAMLIRIVNALGVTVDYLLAGNQESDSSTYNAEASRLLADCNVYEKQVILKTIASLTRILKESSGLMRSKDVPD